MNPLIQEVQQEDGKTTKRGTNRAVPTRKIKVMYNFIQKSPGLHYIFIMFADIYFPFAQVYRIRTPPSAEKPVTWKKSATMFDSTSDGSDQSDFLVSNFYFR